MRRQRPGGLKTAPRGGSASDRRGGPRLRLDSRPDSYAVELPPAGGRCASYMPTTSDPRMLPERPGACMRVPPQGSAGGAAAAAPQLGAALSQGYGRAPTAFVYTSADTLLATSTLQWPAAARQAGGGGGLQAYAFPCGGSASAPVSPLGRRTMLYTRDAQQPTSASARHPPAPDLLDRLALLRRLAPATEAAPRPPQLTAAVQFTPAPPHAPRSALGAGASAPAAPAGTGLPRRRWAWEDSVQRAAAARPIAATPAPGWRYCGDVIAAAAPMAGQPGVAAVAASVGGGCPRSGGGVALGLAVSSAGQEGAEEQEAELVLVVRSPRPHQVHAEDAAAAAAAEAAQTAEAAAAAEASRRASSRAAFRPPGPLRHKFGNKAQPPRPRSAPPSDAERARAAGLRDCGYPHTPRHPAPGSLQAAWEEQAVRQRACPRSAPRSPCQQQHDADVQAASLAAEALHLAWPRSRGGDAHPSAGAAASTVAVSAAAWEAEVLVVSSPEATCIGCRSGREQQEVVVVAMSPRGRRGSARPGSAGGGGDLLVVCCSPPASPPRQVALGPCQLEDGAAVAAAAAEEDQQQRSSRNKLSVTVPAGGGGGSYSIRADACACASPIKAWRQPGAAQPAATPPAPPAPPAQHAAQQAPAAAADAADLRRLESEIQRRERSFAGLLADLERISAKCAQLTEGCGGSGGRACAHRPPGSGTARAPAAVPVPAAAQRPQHTTHVFCGTPRQAAAGGSGVAAVAQPSGAANKPGSGKPGSGGGSKAEAGDWGWEALLAYEQTIREQQRRLVEQGVLPPEYA